MTALDNKCDVCHRDVDQVWVHASSLAPMSFASCRECLQHYAEMPGTFAYIYDYVSNEGEGLIEDIKSMSTWMDGKYYTWEEWVAWRKDPVRKAELDAAFKADMEAMENGTYGD